jgi:hypothetical protein
MSNYTDIKELERVYLKNKNNKNKYNDIADYLHYNVNNCILPQVLHNIVIEYTGYIVKCSICDYIYSKNNKGIILTICKKCKCISNMINFDSYKLSKFGLEILKGVIYKYKLLIKFKCENTYITNNNIYTNKCVFCKHYVISNSLKCIIKRENILNNIKLKSCILCFDCDKVWRLCYPCVKIIKKLSLLCYISMYHMVHNNSRITKHSLFYKFD